MDDRQDGHTPEGKAFDAIARAEVERKRRGMMILVGVIAGSIALVFAIQAVAWIALAVGFTRSQRRDGSLGAAAEQLDLPITVDFPITVIVAARNEAERLPESRDLVWIVENTFPEQYNHRPTRLKLWALGCFGRRAMHKIAPWFFDKPAFLLSQDPNMPYGEMRKRKTRTDLRYRGLMIGLGALAAAGAAVALR